MSPPPLFPPPLLPPPLLPPPLLLLPPPPSLLAPPPPPLSALLTLPPPPLAAALLPLPPLEKPDGETKRTPDDDEPLPEDDPAVDVVARGDPLFEILTAEVSAVRTLGTA